MIRGGSLSAGLTRGDGKYDKFVEPRLMALPRMAWTETAATIPSDEDPASSESNLEKV